ncbi:hypothetical protein AKJ41_00540 [candidate division MSBL1 archaeon SCGC-AAA259O05]|uniref:Uncharacterized protein n=1 Tax=candidate division MSBL1 archaeon SCGC-AAA259O05 TaxID=1698271 RepID=A0A133V5F8_9EURY|nr:hypothetical protein AKJ41_00540 [candidate division MSBL1 archaeon SCGC-AAA259O05]
MMGLDIMGLILVIVALILLSPMILAVGGIIAVASLLFAPFWAFWLLLACPVVLLIFGILLITLF